MIRKARPEDIPHLLEIERDSFRSDFLSEQEFNDRISDIYVLADELDTVIYGYFCVEYNEHPYLYSLAIHKYHRRKGYSRLLLEKFLSIKSPIHILHVAPNNEAAKTLYESYGFKTLELISDFYEDGGSALLMQKRDEDESK